MITKTELLESTHRKELWMVKKKEKLLIVNCILILIWCYTAMRNLLQFTINVQKSQHIINAQYNWWVQDRVRFICIYLHVSLCGQQHPEWKQAIHIMHSPFFCKLRSSSNPTHTNLTVSSLETETVLSWLSFKIRMFSSQWSILSPPQNTDLSSWINLFKKMSLTNSLQQSPSLGADSSSASQCISCIILNMKVHYHVHNSLLLVPILSQINPCHPLPY